jgi:hypothetical protein
MTTHDDESYSCSFCGKSSQEVSKMIVGPPPRSDLR